MINMNIDPSSTTILAEDVYEQFLERIGYSTRPEPTLEILNAIYKSWCRDIGYDNVLKRIYFAENHEGPFPVMNPNDFLKTWMKHGTSGSCWPSGEALYSVLSLTGFKVERVAGQMLECNDPMDPNHGAMIVNVDGKYYHTDPGIVSEDVLQLIDGKATQTDNKAFGVWSKGDGHVWWRPGHSRTPIEIETKYRNLTYDYFATRYEKTKEFSLFNSSLYIRRNQNNGILTYGRGNIIRVNSEGEFSATPIEQADLATFLIENMGLSEEIVARVPLQDEAGAEFG